ncbi:hypothetical protein [Desulfofundulus thermobenzoicus]
METGQGREWGKLNTWEEIIKTLHLTPYTPMDGNREITGAYCGDLLSDVLARAQPGNLWITIQRHRNVVAVASLTGLAGVIISGGRVPNPDTIEAAMKEQLLLFSTPLDNFTAAGKLYWLLQKPCHGHRERG